ncbi:MAG: FAD-dependent oxidoreductase, partial [Fidelibacterota bacterium]
MSDKRYRVEVPDDQYYQRLINCQSACPVSTHAGGYIAHIARGEYEKAYMLARKPNPFPYVCGRVCGHPCESACRRGKIDEPVAIRALKRKATDNHQVGYRLSTSISAIKGEKVAIIGAGPAGLACAYELSKGGYRSTIFEARAFAGGMLRLGIPEYRLPRKIIDMEISDILGSGIKLAVNKPAGDEFSIKDLQDERFRAIFLATGATKGKEIHLEGVHSDGVLNGLDFLLNVNLGYRVELGSRVIVIGGGNVAIDVARTAARRGKEEIHVAMNVAEALARDKRYSGFQPEDIMRIASDAARTALRLGAEEVHIVCLESRSEMPAHEWEVNEALNEGILIHPSLGPKRILSEGGRVIGLETVAVKSVFDDEGRFNPTFIPGSESIIEADTVILAIGQIPDLSYIRSDDGIEITKSGLISVDRYTLATSAPGIFAGGDVAFGPRLVIEAIADGKRAAESIIEHITGSKPH